MPPSPERGEVWLVDLDPVLRGEQGGTRPVVVLSTDAFNRWPVGLVVVVPLTTSERGFSHHVPVVGGGLDRSSFAMPEYVRSIVQERLRRRLGEAEPNTLDHISDWVRRIAGL